LSPLLFVLAADLLQSIIIKAKDCGILKLPIPFSRGSDFPIIQYADDTIMILEACPRQLFFLKAMLNSFADSTGLHVNYNKSNIYPINVSEQKMVVLANTFHCKIGSLPFTYLGLPLGLRKPNLEAFLPLIQRIERRLASTSIFLSQAGRLQMVNAVFSSLPTYYMCTLKLPKNVIKQIDKLQQHCLWRGADINAKKPPLVDWKSVCKPKIQGGLGVINLELQNKALLMKCLHKFYNRVNIPWVNIIWDTHYNNSLPSAKPVGSFWWKDILKIHDLFKEIARVEVGNGKTTLLWHDRWNGQRTSERFPELWSFASVREINIHQARLASPNELFHTPLSAEAFGQLLSFQDILADFQLHDHNDIWRCSGSSNLFSSQKVYAHLIGAQQSHPLFSWLWKSKCQPKHKVFFWLLLKDRLNTCSLLRRRSMPLDSFTCDNCILQIEETLIHLFFICNFARRCWLLLGFLPPRNLNLLHTLLRIRRRLQVPWRLETIIIMTWCIWRCRNNWIFMRSLLPFLSARRCSGLNLPYYAIESSLILRKISPPGYFI
jgi:hypothetical protein